MFKLNRKVGADLLLYLLSHFCCNGHTVHMLTQSCLLPPLTSTSTSTSTYHSSCMCIPVSLAARLHQCHANCSHYVNSGWMFSRQTLYFLCLIPHLLSTSLHLLPPLLQLSVPCCYHIQKTLAKFKVMKLHPVFSSKCF